jgi:hypothetical protein
MIGLAYLAAMRSGAERTVRSTVLMQYIRFSLRLLSVQPRLQRGHSQCRESSDDHVNWNALAIGGPEPLGGAHGL